MKSEPEVGIARTTVELARQAAQRPEQHASAYLCYWMAFTSIYATLGAQAGVRPHFSLHKNGTLQTHHVGPAKMVEVYPPAESALLAKARAYFPQTAKHKLVTHDNTRFFVDRTPIWQGKGIAIDSHKQRLNGVIDMWCTLDARYPVWSPIDARMYTAYTRASVKGEPDDEALNILVGQVLDVLHTVYRNLLYSGKPASDENAPAVIDKALPLLSDFIEDLLRTEG